jgi:glucose 1-dehydrogenase
VRHEGKIAVVTGAASGIGLATAQLLLAEGAKVVMADIDEAGVEREARNLDPSGASVKFVRCDVAKRADVVAAITLAESFGELDIMVNNAGIVLAKEVLDVEDQDMQLLFDINVMGAFYGTQEAARRMVGRGKGSIVNMSSMQGLLAIPNQLPYGTSKAAIIQLSRVFAVSLAPKGIRVNAVGPGTISTEAAKRAVLQNETARRSVMSRIPMLRLGLPAEVASVISFLASDDAAYVTGQTIFIDGGRSALNMTVPVPDEA